MVQSTLPYIAFQGVFGAPGVNLLLSPVAFIARIYFHGALANKQATFQTGTQYALGAIMSWGARLCGLKEEFAAAAKMIDIASSGVELSDATDALIAQISHIFTYSIYGTSLETALQKQSGKTPSYDLRRLSQEARRFFLALAQFHCALHGGGSELLLFRNISYLHRRFKVRPKCKQLIEYLLPTEKEASLATSELLERVFNKTHETTLGWAQQKLTHAANSTFQFIGWKASSTQSSEEEKIPPLNHPICWTATRAIC